MSSGGEGERSVVAVLEHPASPRVGGELREAGALDDFRVGVPRPFENAPTLAAEEQALAEGHTGKARGSRRGGSVDRDLHVSISVPLGDERVLSASSGRQRGDAPGQRLGMGGCQGQRPGLEGEAALVRVKLQGGPRRLPPLDASPERLTATGNERDSKRRVEADLSEIPGLRAEPGLESDSHHVAGFLTAEGYRFWTRIGGAEGQLSRSARGIDLDDEPVGTRGNPPHAVGAQRDLVEVHVRFGSSADDHEDGRRLSRWRGSATRNQERAQGEPGPLHP